MPRVSLLIVSPYAILCDLLQRQLSTEDGFACAGVQCSLDGLDEAIARVQPDVVVLDTALQGALTRDVVASYRRRYPGLRFALLYDTRTLDVATECLLVGVDACASKEGNFSDFLAAVGAAMRGSAHVPTDLLAAIVGRVRNLRAQVSVSSGSLLSPRERAILKLVAEGATNRDIAERLGLSPQTVKNALTKVFQQLNVANRAQAAAWWREHSRASELDSR